MNLTETLQSKLENPKLTANERVLLRCQAAGEFIHRGQYEEARDALGELWPGVGERPSVEKLKKATAPEVLLRCGALSSALGSARNVPHAQERAADLISEARRLFERLGLLVKVAEAQAELSVCYWRQGAFDEARVVLDQAAETVSDKDDELKAKILIRRALVETWAGRYHDALEVLSEAESFFKVLDDALKGRWHAQMALVLRRLGAAEGRNDYLDRALIEFTAAIFHYEQSQNIRYCGINLNNLAMLLYRMGRYQEAHEHLDRAAAIYSGLKDPGNLAQVNETRARVLLAEQRFDEAKKIIESSVRVFEEGGEQSCLADALSIQATVLARIGDYDRSLVLFRRAVNVAANAGALENAGHASLSLIEEHGSTRLSEIDVYEAYRRADEFLRDTQDAEDISRLRACAQIVMRRLLGAQISDTNFSLNEALLKYEARFIEEALRKTGGRISPAAKMLGLSHQTLSSIIKNRHRGLLNKRTPLIPRYRSIIHSPAQAPPAQVISILHVEDNRLVSGAVKEMLEMEGFKVTTREKLDDALREITSDKPYDLMIIDNELPGGNGTELIKRVRALSPRRRTPIIMLSASDIEIEAWRAGVDAFLRKPEDMGALLQTVARLLAKDK